MLPILDITHFTFQDFPEHTSCIIWFGGCNFRCPYCHNPEFINISATQKIIDENAVFDFLKSRIGLLDGVVISGGECCLSSDLYDFVRKIKELKFLVKIDTNGTNYELIKKLVNDKLIDFIALDYKSPKNKFKFITGTELFPSFEKTLNFLIENGINMEVRTTVHTSLLNEDDINEIIRDLEKKGYDKSYHIQNFRNDNRQTPQKFPNFSTFILLLKAQCLILQNSNFYFKILPMLCFGKLLPNDKLPIVSKLPSDRRFHNFKNLINDKYTISNQIFKVNRLLCPNCFLRKNYLRDLSNKNTLGNLKEQTKILDKNKIKSNKVNIFFRNFF